MEVQHDRRNRMSISDVNRTNGAPRVTVTCDECGRQEVIPCGYEKSRGHDYAPNVGQVNAKMMGKGWAVIKGDHHCPSCEAKRKAAAAAKKEATVQDTNVAPIRQPDGKQKRLIVMALEDAYDDAAKRYKGKATDRSVAEDIGGGIMPGWVASIREELFGPAGNEEAETIRAEIAKAKDETRRLIETFAAEQNKKLDALTARLDALYRAEDKRVRA